MRYATSRGWRSCVLNRRGHAGVDLTSPNFNIVGCPGDTKAQVELVRRRHPHSYMAMVGISAGCGPLMSYLGTVCKKNNNKNGYFEFKKMKQKNSFSETSPQGPRPTPLLSPVLLLSVLLMT